MHKLFINVDSALLGPTVVKRNGVSYWFNTSPLASLPEKRSTCELAIFRLAQSTVVRDFSEDISLPSKLVKGLAKFVKRQTVTRSPSLLIASS